MEDNWKSVKEALTSTYQEVLGLKKHHHKEWISIETLDKIKERKNEKTAINHSRTRAERVQAQAEYIEANKQVKESIRADKKKYMEELATTVEKAAREGNMKHKPERPVKDKEGKPITENQQQRNRWLECFEELLNRPAPTNQPDIEAAHTDLPIGVDPPRTEEIRKIKCGKAAGPDNIPAEALKSDVEVITSMLRLLFKKIWEEEQVPMKCKEGHLIKIPKKGDLSKCGNYRGITLLSTPGKVFNRVLLNRLKDAVDAQLRDQQAGFRRDRSCAWRTADRCIPSKDRSQTKLSTLSLLLFLLVFDWIMKTSTCEGKHGIQWTAQNQLHDLDLEDDLALLSHTHEQMQIKTASVAAVSASVGLNIHKGKIKVLKHNTENSDPITLDDETLEYAESFTCLGSSIDERGGSDAHVTAWIGEPYGTLFDTMLYLRESPTSSEIHMTDCIAK
ncbi:unnamed protein product [Schistosoma curassoni]|uniref:Reverse transcriptase domain-containing protein n=1 Tax=Schistosoma curassoni TaxID=6186 RepID=A0A183L3H5_9TREM|nr:unnamed protein product [Schistosoma curassoni]